MGSEDTDSDILHGLCKLLGYQFSPRLADLPDRRFWRMTARADYGALNGIAANRINTRLIVAHWEDVLRVAGTLHTRSATASAVIRSLQRNGQPTPLARAIGEIGRATGTMTRLRWITDERSDDASWSSPTVRSHATPLPGTCSTDGVVSCTILWG